MTDIFREAYDPRPREHRTWLWDKMIPAGEITLVTGAGTSGKTSAMMILAAAIAMQDMAGKSPLGDMMLGGTRLDPDAEPVVIVTVGEQSEAQLQDLALKAGAGLMAVDGQYFPLYRQIAEGALGRQHFWATLKAARKRWPTSLFVLDCATTCLRLTTNDCDAVREGYSRLREIGGTWAVLHHNNKDRGRADGSPDKVRGASSWVDGCDRLITVSRRPGFADLKASRRGEEWEMSLPVAWQTHQPEPDKKKPGAGRPSAKRDEVEDWLKKNMDFVLNTKPFKLVYERYQQQGGTASWETFYRTRNKEDWMRD